MTLKQPLNDHTAECLNSCPEAVRRASDGGLSALRAAFCETCLQFCPHAKGRESAWHSRMARLEQAANAPLFWNPALQPELAPLAEKDFHSLSPAEAAAEAALRQTWAGAELESPGSSSGSWAGAVVHSGEPDQVSVYRAPPELREAMNLMSGSPAPQPAAPPQPPVVLDLRSPPPSALPAPTPPPPARTPPQAPAREAEYANTPAPPQGGWIIPSSAAAQAQTAQAPPRGSVLLGTATGPSSRDQWSLTAGQEAAEKAPLLRKGKKRVVRASSGEDV